MKKDRIFKMVLRSVIIFSGLCLVAAALWVNPFVMGIKATKAQNHVEKNDVHIDEQKAAQAAVTGPCDIYAAGGTPCVAAHSTVRALYASYGGNLYQVRRSSDNTTRNIPLLSPGGYADSSVQDSFCAGTECVITVVYDQSGNGNDLWYQGSAEVPGSVVSRPATATRESLNVGGNKVYSLYIDPNVCYWRDGSRTGIPTGADPEGMYMVTSGVHYNGGCCFNYGNSEVTRMADGAGTMDAINFSNQCWFGGCSGSGPWVQADLEWGLYSGGSQTWNPNQKSFPHPYVTAMLKNNGVTEFSLRGSNAQSGNLSTMYKGSLPNGYSPMKKQGAITLGCGGDCCKPGGGANLSAGTFYEGAMVRGYPSDATENAVQENIIAAGYGSGITAVPTPAPTIGPTSEPNPNPIWSGGPYTLNGTTDYIDLPDGITNVLYDFSIACWVKLNTIDTWSRIYDFGGDTNIFMMLTPESGITGYPYFTITISGNDGEQGINGTSALPTGSWQHFAVVKSGNTGILYINTLEVGRNTNITLNPVDLGNTVNNYIGRSQWSQDPYLNGDIEEFSIFNRAISASEVVTLGSTPPGESTPPVESTPGDVNGDGSFDIVDALLIAQYYVDLNPVGFIAANADVDCDGSIDIVDALLVAQYYVELISNFPC